MALSDTELAEIDALLADPGTWAGAPGALRQRFPGLTVTQCAAGDLDLETPFRRWAHGALYLVDRSDHCWRLTDQPERATGLVVAAGATA